MNKIKNKDYKNKLFPNSFTLMCDTYNVKNTIRFFFFCVYYLRITETNTESFLTKNDIFDIYVKSKKYTYALSKFVRIYKFKKYKTYEYDSDLNFIPLNKYNDSEKIKIIQNKTIYNFKLKDLISLWKISLKNSDNMFPLPKPLKNPFTNMAFDEHQLYNIYFKYGFGQNLMPEIITNFFKSNLSYHIFKMESHEKLQINAINNYVNKGTVYNLFEYLIMMFHDFRRDIGYVFLKPDLSIFRKLNVVKNLEKFLKYFLYYKFITNPLRKEYFSNLIKKELKQYITPLKRNYFISLNSDEILRYEGVHTTARNIENSNEYDVEDYDEEEILSTNTIELFNQNNYNANTNINTQHRRSSYGRLFPPIITNTYENSINENSINENSIINTAENPFQPSNELPRTPNQSNLQNNTISSRFNLGLR